MLRILLVIAALVGVVGLPFLLKRQLNAPQPEPDAALVVIISPHNAAIREAFSDGFDRWHRGEYGCAATIEWRSVGGTSEIIRYLDAEYQARSETGIDLFFGGGTYDHAKADALGILDTPWPTPPEGLFTNAAGDTLIPESLGGEIWRAPRFFGTALSTFGICYNPDRLKDLGIVAPPVRWQDLTDFRYFGTLGIADPTKSGSVAKAMEMIVHDQCLRAVLAAGYTIAQIESFETEIKRAALQPGVMPEGIPQDYQAAIERGWLTGIGVLRRLGANARYFTDSAGKVPADASAGVVAAGLVIDFFGRFQAEMTISSSGEERLIYLTPEGGSSVSADPVALLKGAPNRETALRFLQFALGEEGQKLWNYRVGTPGGPRRIALRRLPIRADFYPSKAPTLQAGYLIHQQFLQDDLGDPAINPYRIAKNYPYVARWTGAHFNLIRDLFRAMCMECFDELKSAWQSINIDAQRADAFDALPDDVTWHTPFSGSRQTPLQRRDTLTRWSAFFREAYSAKKR